MIKRLIAILFIYLCTSAAWGILGGTILSRTYNSDSSNTERVGQLWGSAQTQPAPIIYYETQKQVKQTTDRDGKSVSEIVTVTEKHPIALDQTKIETTFDLDQRQKGLLWYATYKVHFSAQYRVTNGTSEARLLHIEFPLPTAQAVFDNFQMTIGKSSVKSISPTQNAVQQSTTLNPGESQDFTISYDSQGLDSWTYRFNDIADTVSQLQNFDLTMKTNFDAIDFPSGGLSPTDKQKLPNGWQLHWNYKNVLTSYTIGISMPKNLNPGPWVSKVTFFAPVSLFLFFFLLFVFTTIKGIRMHPMNYFFIGAAFFSFDLLMAYLVDHISVQLAFLISSIVSIGLVVSYTRLVVSTKFAFVEVGIAQLIYMVGFSYTFFFEQYAGLAITLLCILSLFVTMQFTGRVDWSEVFQRYGRKPSPNTALATSPSTEPNAIAPKPDDNAV